MLPNKKADAASGGKGKEVDLAENNMDEAAHQTIYGRGYDMRKRVVGEEYVAKSLEAGSSDFLRPLQQYATVRLPCSLSPISTPCPYLRGIVRYWAGIG